MSSAIRVELAQIHGAPPKVGGHIFQTEGWSPLRMGAVVCLGAVLGASVILAVAPHRAGAEQGDAGVHAFFRGERMPRAARPAYTTMINPVVRSYVPMPTYYRGLPPAVRTGDLNDALNLGRRLVIQPAARRASLEGRSRADEPFLPTANAGLAGFARQTVCVRTCDGFFFPLGNLASASDAPAQESLCQAACPGTQVKLFTVPAGATDIERAVAGDYKTYASLATAFSFQRKRDASCTCGRGDKRLSIYRDFTLRAGDAVVIGDRTMVFRGGQYPFQKSDFAVFDSKSANLTAEQRRAIDRTVGASHFVKALAPYTYANRPKPKAGTGSNPKPLRSGETPVEPAKRDRLSDAAPRGPVRGVGQMSVMMTR